MDAYYHKALLQPLCLQCGWRGVCYSISLVRWNFFHHASVALNALRVMPFLFLDIELKLKLGYGAALHFMLSEALS